MKVSERQLRKMVREEIKSALNENGQFDGMVQSILLWREELNNQNPDIVKSLDASLDIELIDPREDLRYIYQNQRQLFEEIFVAFRSASITLNPRKY